MGTPHKATPEQWETVEKTEGGYLSPCILELRDRLAALEAAMWALTSTVSKAGNDHQRRLAALEDAANLRQQDEDAERAMENAPADHVRGATEMVATDAELIKAWDVRHADHLGRIRHIYDMGRQHGAAQATCPHIITSDEGTSYCRLAEQGNSSAGLTCSPAPADGLVERVADMLGHYGDTTSRAVILAVADRVAQTGILGGNAVARWLREEVQRNATGQEG